MNERSSGLTALLLLFGTTEALQCHQERWKYILLKELLKLEISNFFIIQKCSINLNAAGEPVDPLTGMADNTTDCWNLEDESFLRDCDNGEDSCALHIDAEWFPSGIQE